jgi:hypothetical protein
VRFGAATILSTRSWPAAIAIRREMPRASSSRAERSMAYGFYAGLKQKDLKVLIAYLRTVPPLD